MTAVRRLDDPAHVARQYEDERGLAARKSIYREVTGPDPRELALEAVVEASATRVLEVGCGEGELAERLAATVELVAIDQSARMVEVTAARGVDAVRADVQSLPFPDDSFDAALAAWMLYHVPDLHRGLAELARVIRPGGRLVAATNAHDNLAELLALGGLSSIAMSFSSENGEAALRRHFVDVERRDVHGTVTLSDIDAVRSYFRSSEWLAGSFNRLPPQLDKPLVASRHHAVFIATKAA